MYRDALYAGIAGAGITVVCALLNEIVKQLVLVNRRLREIAWRLARSQGDEHWLSEHE